MCWIECAGDLGRMTLRYWTQRMFVTNFTTHRVLPYSPLADDIELRPDLGDRNPFLSWPYVNESSHIKRLLTPHGPRSAAWCTFSVTLSFTMTCISLKSSLSQNMSDKSCPLHSTRVKKTNFRSELKSTMDLH